MHDPNTNFRLDRRLQQRRGWIASEQLDKELGALPDVSEKAELVDSPQHKGSEPPATEGDGE